MGIYRQLSISEITPFKQRLPLSVVERQLPVVYVRAIVDVDSDAVAFGEGSRSVLTGFGPCLFDPGGKVQVIVPVRHRFLTDFVRT